jgi:hypothetical protein
VRIEHHWWNRNTSARGRRDVYIRTDGERWEVEARIGGATGRSRLQECPSRAAATILAQAWRGDGPAWPELTKPQGRRPIGPLGESLRSDADEVRPTAAATIEPVAEEGDLSLQPRA